MDKKDLDEIENAIKIITDTLEPHLVKLTPEQRNNLIIIDEEKEAFMKEMYHLALTNPEYVPEEITNDFKVKYDKFEQMKEIKKSLDEIIYPFKDAMYKSRKKKQSPKKERQGGKPEKNDGQN
jgi:hypothetical protein